MQNTPIEYGKDCCSEQSTGCVVVLALIILHEGLKAVVQWGPSSQALLCGSVVCPLALVGALVWDCPLHV